MLRMIWCLTKPLRVVAGFLLIIFGTIPTLLIPGLGLFLGLPLILMGSCLMCS